MAPHCECNGRSATCQRHRPAHVTHPVFPPPPRRQQRGLRPHLAPAARTCRLHSAGALPSCSPACPFGRRCQIVVPLAHTRIRLCFQRTRRSLLPMPPLPSHCNSCCCTKLTSACLHPSAALACRVCSCRCRCRSFPALRFLRLPLPTPRLPLFRLVSPLLTISHIFRVKIASSAAHSASSSARSAAHTAATAAFCDAQRANSFELRSRRVLPPIKTNCSTLNRQGDGDTGPFGVRYCAEMYY